MPRKSTSSVTPADPDAGPTSDTQIQSPPQSSPSQSKNQQATEQQLKARAEGGVNVEDYLLPRSLTVRLAKAVLPPNTTIQKDAVLAMQKAATVFVSYLSSHANEATLKRTVAPADVLDAISELEFDGFRSRLEKELDAYTEIKAGKRKKSGVDGTAAIGTEGKESNGDNEEDNTARGAKRVKRVDGGGEGKGVSGDGRESQDEEQEVEEEDPEEEQEDEEEEEEEGEDEEEQEDEGHEEDDINRVEDLDRDSRAKRNMNPDVAGDESDSGDGAGPGMQDMDV